MRATTTGRWRSALAAALLLSAGMATAQDRIAPDTLQRDVDVLQHAYEALHPGLYRDATPAQVRARFADLRRRFRQPVTREQAFLALSEFAAQIRCGHTFANPENQSKAVQAALFEAGRARLPAEFVWLDGRMVVTRDLSGGALPPGTRIDTINGVPAPDILARLMRIARADGGNDAKRVDLLQVQGTERHETFDTFLPLYYPAFGDRFTLGVRDVKGTTREVRVTGLTHAQRMASRHVDADDATAGWRMDLRNPAFALMTMPTWALYDAKWDWKQWIEAQFALLAREPRPALVIDLRGNEGGLDVGDAILPHLLDAPLDIQEAPRLVRYRKVPDALVPYLDTWDPSFKDWGDDAQPFEGGPQGMRWYRLRGEDPGDDAMSRIVPASPRYTGRVYVLIDASNSSATFQFAERARRAGLVTLVGQPTGGNQRGINGGAFFFLRLPGSGLEMDLPLIARFPMVDGKPPPDAGVRPDVLVARTPDSIAQGRDPWLDAVLTRGRTPAGQD